MRKEEFYKNKLEQTQNKLKALRKTIATNSVFRLLSFALVFIFLFGLIKLLGTIAVVASVFCLITFLFLVRKHISLQKNRNYFSELEKIIQSEIQALDYNFKGFNKGEKYINHRHCYSYDLDIFGRGSLFQVINRTVTESGESLLAREFEEQKTRTEEISLMQDALKELSKDPEHLIHFRAKGRTSEVVEEDKGKVEKWLSTGSFVEGKKFLRFLTYIMPSITILMALLAVFKVVGSSFFIGFFLLNFFIVGFNIKKINKEHDMVTRFLKLLKKYTELLSVIEDKEYQAVYLKEITESLKYKEEASWKIMEKLTKQVSAFDNRLNILAALFLEGVLLWDYHCLFSIQNWKKTYGEGLLSWLDEIARYDALISKATFVYNNNEYVYPEFTNDNIISAENLGHPMLEPKIRISNDFHISKQGQFVIITGANMAGKSTFLRAVGVNLVLARMGLPVCASKFTFKPLNLFTSMRTSDSLADHESYFYAELRRLQEMFTKLENGEELFIILDEILKGTNSVDKQKGSFAAMKKILKMNGTGIIATHDLELTNIEKDYPEQITNKCFEIEIDNAKIHFDYKLYGGVTQKMNALLLMEQMGII
ncbi:MAG: hypothetical protein JXA77_18615 [Bacteroidales bacterium]|nr:hypothetical protein [Bacteroidales bacterium]MBN2818200.1 hypothetical protein [Bacteroidales bacterium]